MLDKTYLQGKGGEGHLARVPTPYPLPSKDQTYPRGRGPGSLGQTGPRQEVPTPPRSHVETSENITSPPPPPPTCVVGNNENLSYGWKNISVWTLNYWALIMIVTDVTSHIQSFTILQSQIIANIIFPQVQAPMMSYVKILPSGTV